MVQNLHSFHSWAAGADTLVTPDVAVAHDGYPFANDDCMDRAAPCRAVGAVVAALVAPAMDHTLDRVASNCFAVNYS